MFGKIQKGLVVFLVISLLIVTILAGCAKPEAAAPAAPATPAAPAEKPIELRWLYDASSGTPKPDTNFYYWWDGFRKAVEQNSNGRVKFVDLVGAVAPPEYYDQLIAGTGDIAYSVIMTNTGRWPTLELACVADLFTNCSRPSPVIQTMYDEFPEIQNGFSEVEIISMYCTPTAPDEYGGIGFATIDRPITTLEEAKGVKMGQYGEWSTKMTASLGFVPVAVPPWEVYESLQRGLVDGSFMDIGFLTTNNCGELVKYWHGISALYCPFWVGMNQDSFAKLPDDIKKVIMDAAAGIPDAADWGELAFTDSMLKAWPNVTNVKIASEEQERWKATQDPVQQEYFDMLSSKGVDGKKIFDRMTELFAQYNERLTAPPQF